MIKIGLTDFTPENKIIEIYDKNNVLKAKYAIGANDVLKQTLMSEHYVEISFELNQNILFSRSDYIKWNGDKYTLREDYTPDQANKRKYKYSLKFEAIEMFLQDVEMYYLHQNYKEASWELTADPATFLQIACDNANRYFQTSDWKIGTVEPSAIQFISFDKISVWDALIDIAKSFESEFFIANGFISLVRKHQYGDAILLESEVSVTGFSRSESESLPRYNQLAVFGSSRNIPPNYRGLVQGETIDAIYQKRLRLPENTGGIIELVPNLLSNEVIEGTIIFDDIYPKRSGAIEEVTTKEYEDSIENENGSTTIVKWDAYRFKDSGISFKESYVLPREELKIKFESGKLNGFEFAVTFNPDKKNEDNPDSQVFEIVRNEEYGTALPNHILKPEVGDKYVLYGFDISLVSDQYLPAAENELLEKATEWGLDNLKDKSIYECQTVIQYFYENDIELNIGQRIQIKEFKDYTSRVQSFEKKLNNRYDCVYTIGDNPSYSFRSSVEKQIEELKLGANYIGVGGGGGGIYIIKRYDGTTPTDFNVFSALRTQQSIADAINRLEFNVFEKYLRKDVQDEAEEQITFLKGLISLDDVRSSAFQKGFDEGFGWSIDHNGTGWFDSINFRKNLFGFGKIGTPVFASGFTGWGTEMDLNQSSLELDFLTVRKTMRVYELVINQLRGQNGSLVISDFNKLESVEDTGTAWRCWIDDYDGEMYMNMRTNDILRCQVFDGNNVKYYVAKVVNVSNKYFDLDKNMIDGIDSPAAGDVLCRWNNYTDTDRQGLIYLTSSDSKSPYLDVLDGGPELTEFERLRVRMGRLDGITDPRFPDMKKYGLYTDSFYGKGELILHSSGMDLSTMFAAIEGRITAEISEVKDLIPDQSDNILKNSTFSSDTFYWDYENNGIHSYKAGNNLLFVTNKLFQLRTNFTGIVQDSGRRALKIVDNIVIQSEINYNKPEAESEFDKYELSYTYKINKPGKLAIGIPNTELFIKKDVEVGTWKSETIVGEWEQSGDFKIEIQGGELLIYNVSLKLSRNGNIYDAIEALRVEYTAGLDITAQQVKLYADEKYTDLYGRVTEEYNAAITVSSQNINLSITGVQTQLSQFKSTTETSISLINGQIALKVNKADFDALGNRVSTSESSITQLWNQIALKVNKTDYDDLFGRVTTTESYIIMLSNSINAKVSQTDFDQYKNVVSQTYATTVWTSTLIYNYVLRENYTGEMIASLINQSAEGVKIFANKVEIRLGEYNSVIDSEDLKTTPILLLQSQRQSFVNIESPFGGFRDFITYIVNADASYHLRFQKTIARNGTYTFSAYIRPYRNCSLIMDVADNVAPAISLLSYQWKRCYITVTIQNYSTTYSFCDLRFFESNGSALSSQLYFNIAYVKVEESNVPTNWTPRPDEISQNVQNAIANAKVDIQSGLGNLAFQNTVEAAMKAETLIAGGYLKNTLIDTGWLRSQIVTANYISALEVDFYKGKIGYFSINEEGLYSGIPSKWTDKTYKQNLASITPGLIRLQRQEGYSQPGDVANIKVGIGDGADPEITGYGKLCYSAGYFYRNMNASAKDAYTPAVKIISENTINRDVALYTKGAIVCKGGLVSVGHFSDTDVATELDFSFGTTVLISNTTYRYVYLPKLSDMKLLLNNTGKFIVPVRIVAQYNNTANFIVAFQTGESTLHFRDYNGGKWTEGFVMGSGDIAEFLLIYDGINYYAQVLNHNL